MEYIYIYAGSGNECAFPTFKDALAELNRDLARCGQAAVLPAGEGSGCYEHEGTGKTIRKVCLYRNAEEKTKKDEEAAEEFRNTVKEHFKGSRISYDVENTDLGFCLTVSMRGSIEKIEKKFGYRTKESFERDIKADLGEYIEDLKKQAAGIVVNYACEPGSRSFSNMVAAANDMNVFIKTLEKLRDRP